jgi:hypothetical protein
VCWKARSRRKVRRWARSTTAPAATDTTQHAPARSASIGTESAPSKGSQGPSELKPSITVAQRMETGIRFCKHVVKQRWQVSSACLRPNPVVDSMSLAAQHSYLNWQLAVSYRSKVCGQQSLPDVHVDLESICTTKHAAGRLLGYRCPIHILAARIMHPIPASQRNRCLATHSGPGGPGSAPPLPPTHLHRWLAK